MNVDNAKADNQDLQKARLYVEAHSPLLQPGSTLLALYSRPVRALARWDTTPHAQFQFFDRSFYFFYIWFSSELNELDRVSVKAATTAWVIINKN
jgi:hypothetical protein